MDIFQQVRQFRRALLARESGARQEIVASYGQVQQALLEMLAPLQERIAQERAAGRSVSAAWLYRQERYQQLLAGIEGEVARWAGEVARRLQIEQQASLAAGARDAAAILSPFASPSVPTAAFESAVGALADGTPLQARFQQMAPLVRDQVKRALLTGVLAGQPAKVVAKRVQGAAALPRHQAERLVRTEMMRAYREGSLATYQEHPDLVSGWIWVASLSGRSCAACLAMHGSVHPLSEPFGSHPNCRCSPAPLVLGVTPPGGAHGDRSGRAPQSGEAWLLRQDEEAIARVLGPTGRPDVEAARALRSGEVRLGDFVVSERSRAWGVTRRAGTLEQARKISQMPPETPRVRLPEDRDWPAPLQVLYTSETGARVFQPLGWDAYPSGQKRPLLDVQYELDTARKLADNDIEVVLLADEQLLNVPSPDAYLLRPNERPILFDFKRIDASATNARRSASSKYVEAKRQGANPLIVLVSDISGIGGVLEVNYGIRAAMSHDLNSTVQYVGLLNLDGKVQILTTEEIKNGVRFR